MNYSREFENWWAKNGLTSEVPALMNSYKEMAWKSWQAAYELGYKDATPKQGY